MQEKTPLTESLETNLNILRDRFDVSSDLTIRDIQVAGVKAAIVSIEGMIDRHMMADAIILPLMNLPKTEGTADRLMETVKKTVLGGVDLLQADTVEQLTELIISGFAANLCR